jgi:hypothetical protein
MLKRIASRRCLSSKLRRQVHFGASISIVVPIPGVIGISHFQSVSLICQLNEMKRSASETRAASYESISYSLIFIYCQELI